MFVKRLHRLIIAFCLVFFLYGGNIDISLGNAFNLNQNLSINRNGEEDINLNASFKTNGLRSPQYYSIRFGREVKGKNFEFEFIHHKLYLDEISADNGSSETVDLIEKFEVTDGYNLLMINLKNSVHNNIGYRVGLGTVVSHPDIIIEGETNYVQGGGLIPKFWTDGYSWSGVSSQFSIFLNKELNDKIHYNIEGKAVMAKTKISIVDGSFDLPNISLHILLGISFSI